MILLKINKEKIVIYLVIIFSALFIAAYFGYLPTVVANLFFSRWFIFLFIAGVAIERNENFVQKITARMNDVTCWIITITFVFIAIYIEKPVYFDCIISAFIMLFILPIKSKSNSLLNIGDASYTIYLTHNFVVMAYGIFVKKTPNAFACAAVGLATILLCIPFGFIMYKLVEKRIHK